MNIKKCKQATNLISQALSIIGDNISLDDTKMYLRKALSTLNTKSKQITKRNLYAEKFLEEGKNKHKKFMEMIAENAKKIAEEKQKLNELDKKD